MTITSNYLRRTYFDYRTQTTSGTRRYITNLRLTLYRNVLLDINTLYFRWIGDDSSMKSISFTSTYPIIAISRTAVYIVNYHGAYTLDRIY